MKTLFQKWCEENNKAPLPEQYHAQENPYLQALKLAEIREATFQQRQARRVRTWFHYHPECKQLLLPLDWRDDQVRGASFIDVDMRHGHGWFDRAVGVRVSIDNQTLEIKEDERPEHRLSQSESYNNALAVARAMGSARYQAEITAFVQQEEAERKAKRVRKSKVSDKQLSLDMVI